MTQVYTAPFLLVRPAARPESRSEESIRLERRIDRCRHLFTLVMCGVVALLAYEIQVAKNLGIPFVELPAIQLPAIQLPGMG